MNCYNFSDFKTRFKWPSNSLSSLAAPTPWRSMVMSWNTLNKCTWKSVGHKVLFLLYTCTTKLTAKVEVKSRLIFDFLHSWPHLAAMTTTDDTKATTKHFATSFCHKSSEKNACSRQKKHCCKVLFERERGNFLENVWSIFILFVSRLSSKFAFGICN